VGLHREEGHPTDRRRRVLHVLYTEADRSFVKREICLPVGKQPSSDRLPAPGEIVCPAPKNAKQDHCLTDTNIFRETEDISLSEDISLKQKKYSVETAPSNGIEGDVGAELARFERMLKGSAEKIETETLQTWGDYLTTVHLESSLDDPNAQRAGRLVGEVEYELSKRCVL
jgi:hypothetical protein